MKEWMSYDLDGFTSTNEQQYQIPMTTNTQLQPQHQISHEKNGMQNKKRNEWNAE